jgi:hypothetical protein
MAQRQIWKSLVRWRWLWFTVALLALFAAISQWGISSPDPAAEQSFVSRADIREQGAVIVRAAVLTDDESERYFGASLADHGIQAIWLSVNNAGESPLQFLPIVTDPNYFSEAEIERLLSAWWRGRANASITAAVARARMPDIVPPKEIATGFVFTHREGGLKLFTVGFETGTEELLFRFALPIPGVRGVSYAIEKVDFANIYRSSMIEDVDLPTLREKLAQLPCCATDKSGENNGDPLNIVIVGRGLDALFSFTGRGWRLDEPFDLHSTYRTIQAFLFRNEYLNAPVSPLHVFGREQEVALQKARNNISLRNHLRLWLAPFMIDGLQVWIGQISRDIGIKLTTQVWYLTTHRISPDVDQDRFYLLQDLIMSGAVSRFGYVQGVGASTSPNLRTNLGGDPYVTDGLRLVIFLGTSRRAFDQIDLLDWDHPRR